MKTNKIRLHVLWFAWHLINMSVCFPCDYTNNTMTLLKQIT